MDFIYKHRNKLFIIVSILLLIPFLFNIGLEVDEPFTMGLIRNNYGSIIHLTALDIHPPLYYLVLKAFLSITTFWTTDIFVKIIFARLLSVIFSIIAFIYLHKILVLLKINHNVYLEWLLFLVLPLEMGLLTQTTNIRMYALITLLFVLVVYNLIKFHNNSSSKNLISIYIFSTLSLYTHYFGGLIVGIFLICYLILNVSNAWKNSIKIAIAGILSLISFIPWIPSLKLQLSQLLGTSNSGIQIKFSKFLLQYAVEVFLIFIIFGIPVILIAKNNNKKYKQVLWSLLITLIIAFIANVTITSGVFSPRYLSSIAVVIEFIGANSIINNNNYKNIYKKLASILMILFTFSCLAIASYRQIFNYALPSISFAKKFQSIKNDKKVNINTHKNKIDTYVWNTNGGNSIYLSSINKRISDKNYMKTNDMISSGNVKLFKAVFPSINHYVIQTNADKNNADKK